MISSLTRAHRRGLLQPVAGEAVDEHLEVVVVDRQVGPGSGVHLASGRTIECGTEVNAAGTGASMVTAS